jgi:hypothetical protein
MSETVALMAAPLLSLTGMAWLALSMEVHWGQVMHRPAGQAQRARQWLRGFGALALLLSLLACFWADRPSMAVLVWTMLLVSSALAVAMLLSRWPRCLRVFAGDLLA